MQTLSLLSGSIMVAAIDFRRAEFHLPGLSSTGSISNTSKAIDIVSKADINIAGVFIITIT